jgi:3-methyl-2-oxobutanoate hydroxymethyltransferase
MKSKVTIPSILNAKKEKRKISMLTAYDYLMAKILDEAEIDILLVGDSVGFVHMGLQSTIPVTMDQMVYHSSIVARATERALVITDMPFGSYTVSKEEAVKNAIRLVKDGGAHGVKLEGGKRVLDKIKAIIEAEIPVMGHNQINPHFLLKMQKCILKKMLKDLSLLKLGVYHNEKKSIKFFRMN